MTDPVQSAEKWGLLVSINKADADQILCYDPTFKYCLSFLLKQNQLSFNDSLNGCYFVSSR